MFIHSSNHSILPATPGNKLIIASGIYSIVPLFHTVKPIAIFLQFYSISIVDDPYDIKMTFKCPEDMHQQRSQAAFLEQTSNEKHPTILLANQSGAHTSILRLFGGARSISSTLMLATNLISLSILAFSACSSDSSHISDSIVAAPLFTCIYLLLAKSSLHLMYTIVLNIHGGSSAKQLSISNHDNRANWITSISILTGAILMSSIYQHHVLIGLFILILNDLFVAYKVYLTTNERGQQQQQQQQQPAQLGGHPPQTRSTLKPTSVSLKHTMLFLLQKVNFYIQAVYALYNATRLRLFARTPTDTDVIDYILNSSVVTFANVQHITDASSKHVVTTVTISDKGFAFPLLPDQFDNQLEIEVHIHPRQTVVDGALHDTTDEGQTCQPQFQLESATLVEFKFNGETVTYNNERLAILSMMLSSVYHPMIHSMFNELYESSANNLPAPLKAADHQHQYDDMLLHGQYLNEIAHTVPSFCFGITPEWYETCLSFNSARPIRRHSQNLFKIKQYSRFINFLFGARTSVFKNCKKHQVPFNPEHVFITSVLHSLDHFTSGDKVLDFFVEIKSSLMPNKAWFNILHVLFYLPSQYFFTNRLCDKSHKTAFYSELYHDLLQIDPEYANIVTLSISY